MIRCTVTQFTTDRTLPPAELAVAVETRGLDGIFFPEHTHLPVASRSKAGSCRSPIAVPAIRSWPWRWPPPSPSGFGWVPASAC